MRRVRQHRAEVVMVRFALALVFVVLVIRALTA